MMELVVTEKDTDTQLADITRLGTVEPPASYVISAMVGRIRGGVVGKLGVDAGSDFFRVAAMFSERKNENILRKMSMHTFD
jgi:hypothetical protein